MGTYFEAGIGRSFRGQGIDMGRRAATQALSQLEKYRPSLAIVFACPELDIYAIKKGILETNGDCPLIGTSTAGEIANGLITRGVVVTVTRTLTSKSQWVWEQVSVKISKRC